MADVATDNIHPIFLDNGFSRGIHARFHIACVAFGARYAIELNCLFVIDAGLLSPRITALEPAPISIGIHRGAALQIIEAGINGLLLLFADYLCLAFIGYRN